MSRKYGFNRLMSCELNLTVSRHRGLFRHRDDGYLNELYKPGNTAFV